MELAILDAKEDMRTCFICDSEGVCRHREKELPLDEPMSMPPTAVLHEISIPMWKTWTKPGRQQINRAENQHDPVDFGGNRWKLF
jgi:hypothetical protein